MNHFEEEYKKRFNNQELPNEDFDVEGLWDDIVGDKEEKPIWIFSRFKYFWILLLLVSIGTLGVLVNNQQSIKKDSTQDEIKRESSPVKTINSEESKIEKVNKQKEVNTVLADNKTSLKSELEEAPQVKLEEAPQVKLEEAPQAEVDLIADVSSQDVNNQANTDKEPVLSNRESAIKDNEVFLEESGEFTEEQKLNILEYDIVKNRSKIDDVGNAERTEYNKILRETVGDSKIDEEQQIENPIVARKHTSTILFIIPKDNRGPAVTLKQTSKLEQPTIELPQIIQPEKIAWKAGLFVGTNYMDLNYDASIFQERDTLNDQQPETALLGLSVGAEASMIWKNHWVLSAGVEYHELFTKFEHIEQEIFMDVVSTRYVLHYNSYKKISIPFSIGFQENKGRLIYGAKGGMVFDFYTFQSGKTLHVRGLINDFDENGDTAPFAKTGIHFRITPFVGLGISENLTASIRPQINWGIKSVYGERSIRFKAKQFNLNLGMNYSF